ncbi:hypothetical protein B0T14DRAFT_523329 [Immersiella caudata]|uniref:Heterokaryon incompatibility domain-containing protein n=1 Tax=Immersiella caudata TaxID=314043 RepID=A0AA39WJH8_9PEZI|nr:hypothetical protein B0T14DRAFT_523329 [Immersiella caudata]
MGDIYAAAAETVIWLGPEMGDEWIIRWLLKTLWPALSVSWNVRVARQALYDGMKSSLDRNHVSKTELEAINEYLGDLRLEDPTDPKTWMGIVATDFDRDRWEIYWITYFEFFAKRAWFHRCWVVQEAVLSKNATIAAGPIWDVTWEELGGFSAVVRALDIHNTIVGEEISKGYNPPGGTLNMSAWDIQYLREQVSKTGDGHEYAPLFAWKKLIWPSAMAARRRDATLAVDRIYSIVGLMKRVFPRELDGFTVDYESTARLVFTQFTKQAIERSGSLFHLAMVEDDPARDVGQVDLPSWVPNFCTVRWETPIYPARPIHSQISALDGNIRSPHVSDGRLVVSGVSLGKLRIASMHPREIDVRVNVASCFFILAGMDEIYAPTGEGRVEAVWRTMVMNQSGLQGEHHPARPRLMSGFRHFFLEGLALRVWDMEDKIASGRDVQGRIANSLEYLTTIVQGLKGDPRSFPTMEQIRVRAGRMRENTIAGRLEPLGVAAAKGCDAVPIREFYEAFTERIGPRKMFLTKSGLLGICNWCSKLTDELWLLDGGDLPYLLRPREDGTYTFMGSCYVHGGMEGELATDELRSSMREIAIV